MASSVGFGVIVRRRVRDWRWLWLRRRVEQRYTHIGTDLSHITVLRPYEAWFADELERAGATLVERDESSAL